MKNKKKEIIKLMLTKQTDHQENITKEKRKNQGNIKVIKKVMILGILVKKKKVITLKYQIMIVNKYMVIINSTIRINGLLLEKKMRIRNTITNITENKNINKKKSIMNKKTATTNIIEIEKNKTHLSFNKN